MHILGNDGKNDDKYAKTIRWCKEVFSTFRIEERRKVGTIMALVILRHSLFPKFQVLGIRPYSSHWSYRTQSLAEDLLKAMKAQMDPALECTYTKHLALLVS